MPGLDVILQVTLLGGRIAADRAKELPRVDMKLYVLFVIAAIRCLVLAMWATQRFGAIVNLPGMASHLMLVGS